MTRRRHRLILLAISLTIASGLALATRAVLRRIDADRPVEPTTFIQKAFRDARGSVGHTTHLAAGVACAGCHQEEGDHFDRPTRAACDRCHAEVVPTLHASALGAVAATDCLTCHDFAGDRFAQKAACGRCHQPEQHREVACATCHDAHGTPSLRPPDCVTCHEPEATHHGDQGVDGARTCLDCHSSHDTREAADRRCASCHRGATTDAPKVPASATFAGHDKCVGCHAPHDFSPAAVVACASCHEDVSIPVAAKAHQDCKSCHTPHAPKGVIAAPTCATCHEDVEPPTEGHTCVGCHQPHPADGKTVAAACASCHTDQEPHAKGLACASCHTPHRVQPRDEIRLCTACHKQEVAQTARTRAKPTSAFPGHRDCRACHATAAHAPARATPACVTCHMTQHATAPAGHQDCVACHEVHDGAVRREATCASCHAPQRAGHGEHTACASCHRPHGPRGPATPPACASCHDTRRLPSLHQAPGHAACATCHTAHEGAPRDDRATCITSGCHADMRAHEPDAKKCSSCHPFTRGAAIPAR